MVGRQSWFVFVVFGVLLKHVDGETTGVIFRAARGFNTDDPLAPTMRDAWLKTSSSFPTIGSDVSASSVSLDPDDKLFFKSSVIDCAWDKITKLRLSIYTGQTEAAFFEFYATGSDKENWFTQDRLTSSSYQDLKIAPDIFFFTIDGIDNPGVPLAQHFLIHNTVPSCADDFLWLAVQEALVPPGLCAWPSIGGPELPILHYSGELNAVEGPDVSVGDVLIITATLEDGAFGDCILSCVGVPDGLYHACTGCNIYVECTGDSYVEVDCPGNLEFDSGVGGCVADSSTCNDRNTLADFCKPSVAQLSTTTEAPITAPDTTGAAERTIFIVPSGFTTQIIDAGLDPITARQVWQQDVSIAQTYEFFYTVGISPSEMKYVFKSPIVDCAWDKVLQVRVSLIKDDVEQAFILFNAVGSDKTDFFSDKYVEASSYTDLKDQSTALFSISGLTQVAPQGDDGVGVDRSFYIQQNDLLWCEDDVTFMAVAERPDGYCYWDNIGGPDVPRVLYSPISTAINASEMEVADRLEFTAIYDGNAFGGNCIDDCKQISDFGGLRHSCIGCDVFIQCIGNKIKYWRCKNNMVWDDNRKICDFQSTTCNDRRAFEKCLPSIADTIKMYLL